MSGFRDAGYDGEFAGGRGGVEQADYVLLVTLLPCRIFVTEPVVQSEYHDETCNKINVKNETFGKLLTHCDKNLSHFVNNTIRLGKLLTNCDKFLSQCVNNLPKFHF